jgi:hypothetical protein
MKRMCNQCQAEMIENCSIKLDGALYGIKIKKKGKGLFNSVSAIPKVAVCTNCGSVGLYIDEYKDFAK